MPNWGEHFLIANKILEKKDIDKNLFLFGNILPDIENGYLIEDISKIIDHRITHFNKVCEKWGDKSFDTRWGYENFYNIYSKKLDNPIVMGYYAHLLADFFWNNNFYEKKCIRENGIAVAYINKKGEIIRKSKMDIRIDKQKDFYIFQNYIYKNYDLELPEYAENIAEKTSIIECIDINKEDVKKVLDYIKKTIKTAEDNNEQTQIYTIEELEKMIDDTVEFTMEKLKI